VILIPFFPQQKGLDNLVTSFSDPIKSSFTPGRFREVCCWPPAFW